MEPRSATLACVLCGAITPACVPTDEAADGPTSGPTDGAACVVDDDCGVAAVCLDGSCAICGDGIARAGELCFDTVVKVSEQRASFVFRIRSGDDDALFAGAVYDPRFRRLRRDGTGGLVEDWNLAGGDIGFAAVADLDGDGWDEAALAGIGSSPTQVCALAIDAAGTHFLTTASTTPLRDLAALPAVAARPGRIVTVDNMGLHAWELQSDALVPTSTAASETITGVVAADLDGDGSLEVATIDDLDQLVWWVDGGSGYAPQDQRQVGDGDEVFRVRAGDLDGDGRDEVLVLYHGRQEIIVVPSAGAAWAPERTIAIGGAAEDAMVADLDHDGVAELVVSVVVEEASSIAVFARRGDAWVRRGLAVPIEAASLASLDVDRDGFDEIVAAGHDALQIVYHHP